jgi:protein SCO1/2
MTRQSLCNLLVLLLAIEGAAHHVSAQGSGATAEPAQKARPDATYRGGLIEPPLPKPRITLTDTSGAVFDLTAKTQGYVMLLYFGYTNCPDMCPLEMSMIAKALKKMPSGTADQFKVVFVTTDPARDTPRVLRSWLDRFDKRFIGLTGTDDAIRAAQTAANLPPAKKSAPRPDGTYEVGHAAFVLAYTKDNLAHVLYPMGVTQGDLEHDLARLPSEEWPKR